MSRRIIAIFMTMMIAFTSSPASANWMRARSEHFIVYGDMGKDAIQRFADRLERYDSAMRHAVGGFSGDDGNPVTIFMFGSAEDIGIFAHDSNIAGFYTAGLPGAYAFVPKNGGSGDFDLSSQAVLFHEYAHHFMLQHFPSSYPAWYVEGFAEFYAPSQIERDGGVSVGRPPLYRAHGLLEGDFPLQRMLAGDVDKLDLEAGDAFYGRSWLLCHMLAFTPTRAGQLKKYLDAFGKGSDPVAAARDAFGDPALLSKEMQHYLEKPYLSIIRMQPAAIKVQPITVEALSDSASASMKLTARLARGSREADIQPYLTDAIALAARFPNEPLALAALGEGNLDAKHYDAANAATDRLLAIEPTNTAGLMRRARIAIAKLGDSNDPVAWAAARKLIVAANRAAPYEPWPLVEYYRSFGRAGMPAPAIAFDGLKRALDLAPQVSTIRLMLAQVLLRDHKNDEVRAVIAPLLNDPHNASLRRIARRIADAANGGTTPAFDSESDDDGTKAKPKK